MYKILVVDDEVLTVEFLCGLIPWEQFNCAIEGTALTANQALKIAQKLRPDIIFMDIRMPEMDGITLSKKILEFHPDCHIIVLTAYQDFETAKAAIQIGIAGFILKHELDEKSLSATLGAAVDKLSKQRQIESMVLKKWIYNTVVDGLEEEFPRSQLQNMKYVLLVVMADIDDGIDDGKEEFLGDFTIGDFTNSKDMPLLEVSHLGQGSYGFLYGFFPQASAKDTHETLFDNIRTIESKVNAAINGHSSIVVAGPYNEPERFAQLGLKSVTNEILIRGGSILTQSDYFSLPLVEPAFPENFVDSIVGYIHMRNPSVPDMILEPFSHMPNQGRVKASRLTPIKSLIENFDQMCINLSKPLFRPPVKFGSLMELVGWVSDTARELILVQGNLYSKNQNVASETAKYLENNYGGDLSIEEIARSLYISSGYLRAVFKKEYGCTVNDYLLKVRISEAKRLLLEKDKKIYEIAALCGFKTSQHFSTTFKSVLGVSPKEFMYGYDRRTTRSSQND